MLSSLTKYFKENQSTTSSPVNQSIQAVRDFYNTNTDKFLKVYGDIIQAFRTKNVEDYLKYTLENAELKDGQKILDAGCGIGGPAAYFASQLNIDINGLTISDYQVKKAQELLSGKTLKGKVEIVQGDYHEMDKIFGRDNFDRILFLESFGHSHDKTLLLEKSFYTLKPGGILYIKDLFKREAPNEEDGKKIDRIIGEINKAYNYHVADLTEILKVIRKNNFILLSLKTPDIKVEEFEHLTISNDFQNLFDIAKIISWEDYVFPVDFYELKVMKPPFDLNIQKHLYFLNRPEIS